MKHGNCVYIRVLEPKENRGDTTYKAYREGI